MHLSACDCSKKGDIRSCAIVWFPLSIQLQGLIKPRNMLPMEDYTYLIQKKLLLAKKSSYKSFFIFFFWNPVFMEGSKVTSVY